MHWKRAAHCVHTCYLHTENVIYYDSLIQEDTVQELKSTGNVLTFV